MTPEHDGISRAAEVLRDGGVSQGETIPETLKHDAALAFYSALLEGGDYQGLRAALSEHGDGEVAAIFEALIDGDDLTGVLSEVLVIHARPFIEQARDS